MVVSTNGDVERGVVGCALTSNGQAPEEKEGKALEIKLTTHRTPHTAHSTPRRHRRCFIWPIASEAAAACRPPALSARYVPSKLEEVE